MNWKVKASSPLCFPPGSCNTSASTREVGPFEDHDMAERTAAALSTDLQCWARIQIVPEEESDE